MEKTASITAAFHDCDDVNSDDAKLDYDDEIKLLIITIDDQHEQHPCDDDDGIVDINVGGVDDIVGLC